MTSLKLKLSDIPLFKYVAPEDAAVISRCAKTMQKKAGDVILLMGEETPGVYVVVSGRVGVYARGRVETIAEIGAGEAIGEMSMVQKSKASATIRALEDTFLVLLYKSMFLAEIDVNPRLASAFFRGVAVTVAERLRETTLKVVGTRLSEAGSQAFRDEETDRLSTTVAGIRALVEETRGICEAIESEPALRAVSGESVPVKAGGGTNTAASLADVRAKLELAGRQLEYVEAILRRIEGVTG